MLLNLIIYFQTIFRDALSQEEDDADKERFSFIILGIKWFI